MSDKESNQDCQFHQLYRQIRDYPDTRIVSFEKHGPGQVSTVLLTRPEKQAWIHCGISPCGWCRSCMSICRRDMYKRRKIILTACASAEIYAYVGEATKLVFKESA